MEPPALESRCSLGTPDYGIPSGLPVVVASGTGPSFEALYRSSTARDIRPRDLLCAGGLGATDRTQGDSSLAAPIYTGQ